MFLDWRTFVSTLLGKHFYDGNSVLDNKSLTEVVGNCIRHYPKNAVKIMSGLCRIFEHVGEQSGQSLCWNDCFVERAVDVHVRLKEIYRLVEEIEEMECVGLDVPQKLLQSEQKKSIAGNTSLSPVAEEQIKLLLDRARDVAYTCVEEKVRKIEGVKNPVHVLLASGAKGSEGLLVQVGAMLGSQLTELAHRLRVMTPHVVQKKMHAHGFIDSCFSIGISGLNFYLLTAACRRHQIDSSTKIQQTGYMFRRMSKALEDVHVEFDNSIRTFENLFLLNRFGFDTDHLTNVRVDCITLSPAENQSEIFCSIW